MAYKRISPYPIVEGGTNATSMATQDGVIYFDGSKLSTTNAGTLSDVLTSNGAGVAPSFQPVVTGGGVTIYYIGGRMNNASFPLCSSAFPSYWSTQYGVGGGAGSSVVNMVMPFAMTFSRLHVNVFTNPTGSPCSITLYKNNVVTPLAVAIPAGTTGVFTNVIDTVSVVAGDLVKFLADQASGGSIYGNFSCIMTS